MKGRQLNHHHIYGTATVTPEGPVPAGSWGTWTISYNVPPSGIDDGGAVRIAVRFASDWAKPQLSDPAGDHYLSVSCSRPEVCLETEWRRLGHVRPYQPHLLISVSDAPLSSGDCITVVFGDRSGGSKGIRAQTFVDEAFEFQIAVDRFGTGLFELMGNSPCVAIVPNRPDHLVMHAAGDGSQEHPVRVLLTVNDGWGNPLRENVQGIVRLSTSGVPNALPESCSLQDGHALFEDVRCEENGLLRITAEHELLGTVESNPLLIKGVRTSHHWFWGDLHGQSRETIGTNSAEAYFEFARDRALCDFTGHQGNDLQVTDEFWKRLNKITKAVTEPGKYIAFPGYEWSALTPLGGDHNVYYLNEDCEIYRSSITQVKGHAQQVDDVAPAARLYQKLKAQGKPAVLIKHIGGRRANLDFHDPDLEPVVEVHSSWGTFEWFYHDALRRGYRVGIVANSDGHKGRPGAEHAGAGRFGVYGGLTCMLAESLTRQALFEALKSRRCYGTSGPRIYVDASLAGQMIGSDLPKTTGKLDLLVKVHGTAGIECIDVLAGGNPWIKWDGSPYEKRRKDRIRIRWSGARILNRNRATVWNGGLRISGNAIIDVEGFAFDSAGEGIESWDRRSIQWKSITTGDEDGLIVTLGVGLNGVLEFETPVIHQSVNLSDVGQTPVICEAGGVGQQVIFELAPDAEAAAPDILWEKSIDVPEQEAIDGIVPLHMRISQVDGHRAWTSPWFVQV